MLARFASESIRNAKPSFAHANFFSERFIFFLSFRSLPNFTFSSSSSVYLFIFSFQLRMSAVGHSRAFMSFLFVFWVLCLIRLADFVCES